MPSPAGRLKYAARACIKGLIAVQRIFRSPFPVPASCAQQSSVICVLSNTRGKVPRYQLSFLGHFSWLPYRVPRIAAATAVITTNCSTEANLAHSKA